MGRNYNMQLTKKELIEQYNAGILKNNGIYHPSAFDAYVLVEWNDEYVFGYYRYMENEREFFKVKLHALNDDYFFHVKNGYLKLSKFMRLSYN
jgi:hypothetical protein